MLCITYCIFAVNANLLELFRIQNQIKNSYNDIEKLQSLYKSKIKAAIQKERGGGLKDAKNQVYDELIKCREQNSAFEVLNKIYAEQISDLQRKKATDDVKMEQQDQQIQEGLETIISYTTIINEQSKQIELLQQDVKLKSEIIQQLETTSQDMSVRFKNLEDLTLHTRNETDANSCLPFGETSANTVHHIQVDKAEAFPVLCDSQLAGPGWTVVQRRIDGSVKFYRNWMDYKLGFGNFSGEFFIGLDKLHRMTASRPHELFVHLTNFNNDTSYALYDNIVVAGESEAYALQALGSYSGDAGDSMRDNEHQKFTTYDRDNDASDLNCAETCLGGWWYKKCGLRFVNKLTQKLLRARLLSVALLLFSAISTDNTRSKMSTTIAPSTASIGMSGRGRATLCSRCK